MDLARGLLLAQNVEKDDIVKPQLMLLNYLVLLTFCAGCSNEKSPKAEKMPDQQSSEGLNPDTSVAADQRNANMSLAAFHTHSYFEKSKCTTLPSASFQLTSNYKPTNQLLINMVQRIAELPSKEAMEKALQPFGISSIQVFGKSTAGGFRGLLIESSIMELLVFRGTNNIVEGILDATFFQRNLKELGLPGRAHSGFVEHYIAFREEMLQLVSQVRSKPLILAGHSLGGSTILLAAAELDSKGVDIHSIYTAGAPRLGDQELTNMINKRFGQKYFRLEHMEDVVPHAPPLKTSSQVLAELGADSFLKPMVDAGIKGANFAAPAGKGIFFNEKGIQENVDDVLLDQSYWQKQARNGLLTFPLFIGMNIQNHIPRSYICGFGKNL